MPAASQARPVRSAAIPPWNLSQSGRSLWREPYGPGLSWPLPADASCARAARGLVREALAALGLAAERVDDAVLAGSELAANAWLHALGGEPELAGAGFAAPELWVYPRGAQAAAEIVCGVFDPSGESWRLGRPGLRRARQPYPSGQAVIGAGDDGSGRGLAIVRALSDAAGCHRTRSRLAAVPVAGKVAWFAVRLPGAAAMSAQADIAPDRAARTLARLLTARGIAAVRRRHRDPARSAVSTADGITVRCQDGTFSWPVGGAVRLRGFPDLAGALEDIVWLHEETRCALRPA